MALARAESSSVSLGATDPEGARCRAQESGALSATVSIYSTVSTYACGGFDVLDGLDVWDQLLFLERAG